uniref:ribosomal protein S7 n=1 Tax=Hydrocytium acuminatum TaxID=1745963 RepID=UPI002A83CF8F|nr:ribosomal protein S7 [Hydrocytium acuminatum]WOR09497.1 ribosomal protein S7 [Hydrocytium acuminatum]
MSRNSTPKKRLLCPDPVYQNVSVHMLVNRILKNGKKSLAFRIVYLVLKQIGQKTGLNPIEVWETALNNVKPRVEISARRRRGAIQQIPRVLRSQERGKATAIRWILAACSKRSGRSMIYKLENEISEAYQKNGMAFRKKEELHKSALANQMNVRRPEKIVQAIMDKS